jgi:hypothetical protein
MMIKPPISPSLPCLSSDRRLSFMEHKLPNGSTFKGKMMEGKF